MTRWTAVDDTPAVEAVEAGGAAPVVGRVVPGEAARAAGFKGGTQDDFVTPAWVQDAVFYQIFPDRFRRGEPANDPPHVRSWDSAPGVWDFFGGNLQGVVDKLDYLQSLGVNAIYLNPIFEASTNHKYNTTDYYRVDPHFGDNALLKRLVSNCHRHGIRVVLDGVFNHVGVDFWAFQDVVKRGKRSRYVDWFDVKKFPVKMRPRPTYACWWGLWELPKLNTHNPEVRQYIIDVATYWLKEADIDGWRLDVADEVPHSFWVEFRQAVKAVRADAYLVGEIWHDGHPWLGGDQFDAVMNYRFRTAVLGLLGGLRDGRSRPVRATNAARYDRALKSITADLPPQAVAVQFNLLGSHDTERILTLMRGDKRKVKLAALLMMTAAGAPVIYYGDEVGLEGGRDPDCRRGFPWNERDQDGDLLEAFRSLIALRHRHAALRRGTYRTLVAEGSVYAFARERDCKSIVVMINASGKTRDVMFDARSRGAIHLWGASTVHFERGRFTGTLKPYEAAVFRLHAASPANHKSGTTLERNTRAT